MRVFYSYSLLFPHKPVLYRCVRKKGDGNMANSLTFHVDESVWFKSGEEIKNILSLSIEPEIEISENENYITMTGSLRLDGEYECLDDSGERENEQAIDSSSVRIVHEVRQINDQFAQFLHRFPVEITIPKERVRNMNDVNVTVASFDYRLPETNCLQLSAELEINGIQSSDDQELRDYNFEERVKEIYSENQISFSIDTKADENVTEDLDAVQDSQNDELHVQAHRGPQIELKSREEEVDESNVQGEQLEEADEEETRIEDMINQDSEEVEEQQELKEKESETRSENALYLTKMLSRSEEQFSKLRMRIIQPGESLESIAKAYQIQPTQIARLNHLHDEQIEEGQILYIPVKSKQER